MMPRKVLGATAEAAAAAAAAAVAVGGGEVLAVDRAEMDEWIPSVE